MYPPSCASHSSLASSCSRSMGGLNCAISSSSGAVSMRSLATCTGSGYHRQPVSSHNSGALHDWMVTPRNQYRSVAFPRADMSTRRRRCRSVSRTRKVSLVNEYHEPIRIDTLLAPTLFIIFVVAIKLMGNLTH